LFYLISDPGLEIDPVHAYRYFEDGMLVLTSDGHIADIGSTDQIQTKYAFASQDIVDYSGNLIIPGFIDTHTHYPQTEIIAAHGHQLMRWLEGYAFPAEAKFANKSYAQTISRFFLQELLRNGTTTASVFGTVHPVSIEALFEEAEKLNMRIIGGKVMMDRNAPVDLLDTPKDAYWESRTLIETWHNKRGRIQYAITPRFAITSSCAQLEAAQQLCQEFDTTYLQTHVSENKYEMEQVRQLFPSSRSYLNVYHDYGLVGPRSIFAHGIYLTDEEFALIAEKNAAISFCPTSNMYLGNGLFDFASAEHFKIPLALGTDIGAGTSFSLLKTMAEAYKVVQLRKAFTSASAKQSVLTPFKAFYLATLGAARVLNLDDKLGTLQPGREGDFIVLNPNATPILNLRMEKSQSLNERLFALMMLADDRVVTAVYLMGKRWITPDDDHIQ